MQSNIMQGRQRQNIAKPQRFGETNPKEITLKTLVQLKAKLYANATRASEQNPAKAEVIRKAVDRDASHIAFAINMVTVKM